MLMYPIWVLIFLFNMWAEALPPERPLNILWLIVEDFSPDLSCYGHSDLTTPNIDKLANEGIRYTHAFTTAPVCSASRSAIITGMYQTSIDAHHHRSHRGDGHQLPEGMLTAPEYFQQAGYYTANVKHGFETFKGTGKNDWNFHRGSVFESNNWDSLKVNQPFYAQVNFAPVHRMMYKMPDTLTVDPDSISLPPYYPEHPVARLDWAKYLTKAELLDVMIGEVIEKLERDDLSDQTVIILMADHGRNHIRGKQWLYDPGIHIPLIIRLPKGPHAKVDHQLISAIDILPASLDLAGLEIPDFMHGKSFFASNAAERSFVVAARDRCDESVEYVRSIRDRRYKYIRNFLPHVPYTQPNKYKEAYYPMWLLMKQLTEKGRLNPTQLKFMSKTKPEEELYDLVADPYEIHNLSDDPEHATILSQMRQQLAEWQASTNDQGRTPEDSIALGYWRRKIQEWDVNEQVNNILNQISHYE